MPRVEWSFLMPAEDHKQVKWFLAYCHSRLTSWGIIIFVIIFFGAAISSVGTQISAFFLPSFILALMLASYFLSLFFRPKIEATRILPPSPSAGSSYTYQVAVKNVGRRLIRNLSVLEQCLPYGIYPDRNHPNFKNEVDWLEPNQRATVTLVLRAPRRGTFEFDPLVAGSSFPSGIFRSRERVGRKEKFVTYPKVIRPTELSMQFIRQYQPGGIALTSKIGDSNEFASTREYRQGDRLRDIHWASTARTGTLIVKEYVEEYFVRVGLFLDTELGRFEKHKCFESRISLCAGLAHSLIDKNYIIDLFLSDPQFPRLQIGRGLKSAHQLLEYLAAIEGQDRVDFQASSNQMEEHLPQLSIVIVFLKDWDAKRSSFIKKLRDAGANIKCIIVRDQSTTLTPDDEGVSVLSTKQLENSG